MGLDQYLTAHRPAPSTLEPSDYIGGWEFAPAEDQARFKALGEEFDFTALVDGGSPWAFVGPDETVDRYAFRVGFCVGYWRKANQVHAWFVENVQGGEDECNPFPVGREELKELGEAAGHVIDATDLVPGMVYAGSVSTNDPLPEEEQGKLGPDWVDMHELGNVIPEDRVKIAEELLPTQSGFFFGSTDYDEWYVADLRHTVQVVGKCLGMAPEWEFTYRSSW